MYLALSPATGRHATRHAVPRHSWFSFFMRCHDITRVPMACMSIVRRCPSRDLASFVIVAHSVCCAHVSTKTKAIAMANAAT